MLKRLLIFFLMLPLAGAALARDDVRELNAIAAVVNDDVITTAELDKRVSRVVNQLRSNRTPMPDMQVLLRQVLERMIIEKLQLAEAETRSIRVDDEELNQIIANIAARNGLTLDQFRQVLARDGMPFASFREEVRNEVLMTRVRSRVVESKVNVTPQEIENYLTSREALGDLGTEYHLLHILISVPENASPEQVSKARERADGVVNRLAEGGDFRQLAITWSDGQKALEGGDLGWRKAGQLPAIFARALVKLEPGETSSLLRSPSGFHLLKLLETRGEEQSMVEQTRARHILVRTNAVVGDAQARRRLETLRGRIQSGEDFADLARVHSEDPGSASQGGELGWVSPGQTVPPFEKAMNETPVGQISEPFQSPFGWHIVQPLERRSYDNSDERRRAAAADSLRQRKTVEETERWLRRLRDEAYVEIRLGE